jgi:hypothetical protein
MKTFISVICILFISFSSIKAQESYSLGFTGLEVDSLLQYVEDIKEAVPVSSQMINNYSTSETVTNGKWINDKIIYRKVINFGTMPNATSRSVAHGISNLEQIVTLYGISGVNGGASIPNAKDFPTGSHVRLKVDMTNITMVTEYDLSSITTSYVIIEYTKSI